jgi:hypothetical protein
METPTPRATGWGGRRAGAGRKPLPGGALTASFILSPLHLSLIAQWQQAHGCASASHALRQIVEAVARVQGIGQAFTQGGERDGATI